MQSILSSIKKISHQNDHLSFQQRSALCLLDLLRETEGDEELLSEAVSASLTAIELRHAVCDLLAAFLPLYGYSHPGVDAALRLLAATQEQYQTTPVPAVAAPHTTMELTYQVIATPTLPLAPESVLVVGAEHDLERGILVLSSALLAHSPQLRARWPYLPVQAIAQGSAVPDLVVEVWDRSDYLTTVHFRTIWRGMQRSADPGAWERVSYPRPQLALLYNKERLTLCPYCLHLHRSTCLLPLVEVGSGRS